MMARRGHGGLQRVEELDRARRSVGEPGLLADRGRVLVDEAARGLTRAGRAENSLTWLPQAENIMAMRRPSVPPPITEIGRSSTSLGRTYDMACMFAHRRG